MQFVYLAQLVAPVALIMVVTLWPAGSWLTLFAQVFAVSSLLLTAAVSGIWILPPWWTPYVLAAIFSAILLLRFARRPRLSLLPNGRTGAVLAVLLLSSGCIGAWLAARALTGVTRPAAAAIELKFPLRAGTYFVANGGSNLSVNAHTDALDQSVPAHRPYWGTGYGIDVVKIDRWGLRASGFMPSGPSQYHIFGASVVAPCDGDIVLAVDGNVDLPIPQHDATSMAGNHVILRCAKADIILAHFRNGSVQVKIGARLATGDPIAEVGNSGVSDEPHLHIHAQKPGTTTAPFSGEPLPMTFGGRYLVRNDRIHLE